MDALFVNMLVDVLVLPCHAVWVVKLKPSKCIYSCKIYCGADHHALFLFQDHKDDQLKERGASYSIAQWVLECVVCNRGSFHMDLLFGVASFLFGYTSG